MTWDPMAAWNAAKDAGMLVSVQAIPSGQDDPVSFFARWQGPDRIMGQKTISREYEIEYRFDDCQTLAEDDQVLVADVLYRVREEPYVPEVKDRGEFRRATLTKV